MDSIQLRPYQRDAIDAVHEAYERGIRRPAVGLPTGTGKTIVFSKLVQERGYPALILAHTDELIQQAIEKYQLVDDTVPIGIIKAGLHQVDLPIAVGSIQTVGRTARLEKMPDWYETMVIDEAHHAVAPTYRRVVDWYDEKCGLIFGTSATLDRSDKKALGKVFEEIVYSRSILEMIEEGYLVDIRAMSVKVAGLRLNDAKKVHGDFQDSQIAEMLTEAHAGLAAVAAWMEHAQGRKTILYAPTIASAQDFAQAFVDEGIPATTVSGAMPLEQRRERIKAFRDGDYRVVTNAMVLTEGFDEPEVDCVMVARPTLSKGLYIQMIGRGTRLFPGKQDLLVLDLVGNDERHDLISIPKLFGLDPDKVKTRGTMNAVQDKRLQPEIQARARAGLAASDLDIDSREVNLFDRKDVNWLRMSDGSWVLAGKKGALILEGKGSKWNAMLYPKNTQRPPFVIASEVDLTWAMGLAEEKVVRKASYETRRLIDKTQPWRKAPASDRQTGMLKNLGIPIPGGITSGDASDLLTATISRRDARRNKLPPVPFPEPKAEEAVVA